MSSRFRPGSEGRSWRIAGGESNFFTVTVVTGTVFRIRPPLLDPISWLWNLNSSGSESRITVDGRKLQKIISIFSKWLIIYRYNIREPVPVTCKVKESAKSNLKN
jgi:hypothetical protein